MPDNPAVLQATGDETLSQKISDAPIEYQPTDSDRQMVAEVDRKFSAWRRDRHYHEPQWFVNAAFFRGNHNVHWSITDNRLVTTPVLHPGRTKKQINRVFAKVRARRAKFLKNRATWVIVPARTDLKSRQDARATGKVLDYIWRKVHLEQKYARALGWSEQCCRGFWWLNWDPNALGRVQVVDPQTGEKSVQEAVVGEVTVEVGSPFEVLVGNPGASSLSEQDEIMRVKERTLEDIMGRFPDRGHLVAAETSGDVFQYEHRIANLNPSAGIFGSPSSSIQERSHDSAGNPNMAVVKEYFQRPNINFPKGRYRAVAGGVMLKAVDELPFGLWDMECPFPVVEFTDTAQAGQYWGTTVLEQLVELQREYNGVRSMISTQIKLMAHPKVFVAKQHQIPEGAWTPDAGEIIEYNARPNIPPPTPWIPPNIAADAWHVVDLIRSEFDDISQVFPAAEGKTGSAQSGFQTNLLQEASDSVHGPDIRAHELAIEESAYKIRRIIKQGYDIPRLITVTSSSYDPEVFEFSAEEVDEYAEIVVQAGSALPTLKGARIQSVLDLYAKGLLGNPAEPQTRKKVLNVLDLGGMDDIYQDARLDDDMINIENSEAEDGRVPLASPRFYEDHQAHYKGHIDQLKSPSIMYWPPDNRNALLAHAIEHVMYINHAAAYQMSIEAGMTGLIPPPPPVMPTGAPPSPAGQPASPSPSQTFNESPDQTNSTQPNAGPAGAPTGGQS
jgi:hypothetical protein